MTLKASFTMGLPFPTSFWFLACFVPDWWSGSRSLSSYWVCGMCKIIFFDDSVVISWSSATIISDYAYGLFTNSLMLLCLGSVHSRKVMD